MSDLCHRVNVLALSSYIRAELYQTINDLPTAEVDRKSASIILDSLSIRAVKKHYYSLIITLSFSENKRHSPVWVGCCRSANHKFINFKWLLLLG